MRTLLYFDKGDWKQDVSAVAATCHRLGVPIAIERLRYRARQEGNTVFVNESFVAYPDQCSFLAGIECIDPTRVEEIVGVRMAEDEDSDAPWLRLPSRQHPLEELDDPLPPKVHAVLAQQIFVEKHRLPPLLINRIKRLVAFQNPEF